MRIFKTKIFHKWAKEINLSNELLVYAIDELSQGNFEANLGGNIYKKRIGIINRSKQDGIRTIIAFKTQEKAIYIYGYTKNNFTNITEKEVLAFKNLAKYYLKFDETQITIAIKTSELIEVII